MKIYIVQLTGATDINGIGNITNKFSLMINKY